MNLDWDVEKLIRPELLKMKAYTPVEPTEVLSQDMGIPVERVTKLDGNENPYGCSPRVLQALAAYPYYHLYPDSEQREIRKALSQHIGLAPEYIVAGSGSDELIDLILRLFLKLGDKVINCPPTFGMYPFSTEVCGGEVIGVERKEDFTLDIPAIKKAVGKRAKVVFIASPNNPSGNIVAEPEIRELLETGLVVVIDEAYSEFSETSVVSWVPKYSNLVVLRTFSKWAGLAGLRAGYGVFPKTVAEYLMKIKQPYNINAAAQVAMLESLKDKDYLRDTIKMIIAERARLFTKLQEIKWLRPYPSQGNFILCRVIKGDAIRIHQELRRQGIFVRYFDTPRLRDCLRFSVGKPEDTDLLIAALNGIC